MSPPARILVIKLSALGDVVQAFPAFDRIRAAHPDAHITLLTTPSYAALAAAGPWFDAVEADGRPRSLAGTLALIGRMRQLKPDDVLERRDLGATLLRADRPGQAIDLVHHDPLPTRQKAEPHRDAVELLRPPGSDGQLCLRRLASRALSAPVRDDSDVAGVGEQLR